MKRWSYLLGLAVLLVAFNLRAGLWKSSGTLHIGHRGARALVDENTLESLLKAVELGVDMVEFDIQRTRDGVYKLRTKSGYTPPTLEEVFQALKPLGVSMILDIKVKDPDCIPDIYQLVEKYGLGDRVVYESSYPKIAKAIEKFKPELVSAIYPAWPRSAFWFAQAYGLDCISLYWPFAGPLYVKIAQDNGYKVMVWTINKKKWIKWFESKLKVDGIMTDDPRLFE